MHYYNETRQHSSRMRTARFPSSIRPAQLPPPPHQPDVDPPGGRPHSRGRPPWRQTPLDAGHVTCDACWDATTSPSP